MGVAWHPLNRPYLCAPRSQAAIKPSPVLFGVPRTFALAHSKPRNLLLSVALLSKPPHAKIIAFAFNCSPEVKVTPVIMPLLVLSDLNSVL